MNPSPATGLAKALFVPLVFFVLSSLVHAAPKNQPPLVSLDKDGRLVYDADSLGNRVPDFSHCGYAGADRPIPDAPVRIVVEPEPGDRTARIQRAIDYVAGLPADDRGIRGAVLLLKGRHEVLGGLCMTNSGVVLRGQGMGEGGTVLFAAGLGRRTLIRIAGQNNRVVATNAGWQIQDDYVPVGATSFQVRNTAGLRVGDSIDVVRPCTKAWIERLGATEFGGGNGDWRLTWKPGSRDLVWDRVIQAIDGNRITVAAPITTAIEAGLGGGRVEKYAWPGRIGNVGIENLCLESAFDPSNPRDENHSWMAITMENAENIWVRQVAAKHFAGSMVAIYESCKWVTVEDCLSLGPVSEVGGYRRHTFFTMGQLTLFLRCYAEHGRHDFAAGHCAAGPNAFVQCEARLPLGDSGPIESWASGVLYDNVTIDGNGLSLAYRGTRAQGAGWAAANCVLWQCNAAVIRCENPPGAQNWAFGCWAEFEGDGIWRGANDFVSPDSLYAGQLKDRRGAGAADRLQLMPRPHEESSNPPLAKAQELAAASHAPAPQLFDYIARATQRDPIPSEPGDARRAGSETGAPPTPAASAGLVLTNGWLVCDGKLLTGGTAEVEWWKGNVRPSEASSFGVGVTRFVPGRIGPGFTDDLNELADWMIARDAVALDYHYGLWYDRRRADHERVRRMTGDVWPPLLEQPFARSGQGTAWDGLSKYDLTKFNPWYWRRLREFADVCDRRGLVLFNENYFQHNILEAGAHWADFPWRSANNINHTGFPEPPPYAGDKRIFMAELFYDVTNPVRRELHRRYIRQCLDNFTNNSNVIQFTSAEFTGPLHFMEFWLDTVGEWEQEHGRKELIALSCTRDVQDAVLADPKRSQIVDVIDFRYWWQTAKGLFAPPGGKNLAPRQFERQWRGGRPTDVDLARMAGEYRGRFPAKALICDFDSAGWAWVCAGGSLPRLPRTTDPRLLTAIPRMQPWSEASTAGRWVLRQPHRQYLICLTPRGPAELDLTGDRESYQVQSLNPATGEISTQQQRVAGGRTVDLARFVNSGLSVLWLQRAEPGEALK
jgi:hypothetical protein